MPADSVPRAASEIRYFAQMGMGYSYRVQDGFVSRFFRKLGFESATGGNILRQHPDLAWLLMFHGSGYVRQASMEALTTPPSCPFEVAAVVYRLNDWVANVRTASKVYAKKFLPSASADVVSESTFFLLPQTTYLSRWDDEALTIIRDNIYRTEVLDALRAKFLARRTGRVGQNLRLILREANFDGSLEQLALEAKLPTVRAIAVETLLMGRARWFVRYRKEWIDKVYGITRRVAEFETRCIEVEYSRLGILQAAAQDKSSFVRRIAADFLIKNRENITPNMAEVSDSLGKDRSASVRSRIEFLSRRLAEG